MNKIMKKITALIAAGTLLCLTACNSQATPPTDKPAQNTSDTASTDTKAPVLDSQSKPDETISETDNGATEETKIPDSASG